MDRFRARPTFLVLLVVFAIPSCFCLVVRSILVPALTFELGERAWWPSRSRREPPTPQEP